jgi:hypothetical protein
MRESEVGLPIERQASPEEMWENEGGAAFALPAPGRERLYGRFDGIPPQAATQRNITNRRRVIE